MAENADLGLGTALVGGLLGVYVLWAAWPFWPLAVIAGLSRYAFRRANMAAQRTAGVQRWRHQQRLFTCLTAVAILVATLHAVLVTYDLIVS